MPPEIPVNVIVDVAAAAFSPAVSVVLCATPGARLNVAGFAVTPAGSPVIATATVPANELTAPAVTLTAAPAPPATRVNDAGDSVSVKSGGGAVTAAETVAEWLKAAEVPVKVTVA